MLSSYEELKGYGFKVHPRWFWLHCFSHLDSYSDHSWATAMVKCSVRSFFHFTMPSREEKTSVDSKYQLSYRKFVKCRFGHKTSQMGSNFMLLGYFVWENLRDIPIASRPAWWPPSRRYSPLWTVHWAGLPTPGSEAVLRPLLRPTAILLTKYQLNIYRFHTVLIFS